MEIGEEQEAIEVPLPVHPDDIPVSDPAPAPAAEPVREPAEVPA